jgi:hypothetical protein
MLIYHPIYDINHSLFRALMILENTQKPELHIDLFRIIDFYSIFPHLLKEIKPLPVNLSAFKKVINIIPEPFERIVSVKRIMFELEAIQTTALQNILAKGLIDIEAYRKKIIKRSELALPEILSEEIYSNEISKTEWFRMLINEFPDINLKGKRGLKSRTGLMEFRYDVESS